MNPSTQKMLLTPRKLKKPNIYNRLTLEKIVNRVDEQSRRPRGSRAKSSKLTILGRLEASGENNTVCLGSQPLAPGQREEKMLRGAGQKAARQQQPPLLTSSRPENGKTRFHHNANIPSFRSHQRFLLPLARLCLAPTVLKQVTSCCAYVKLLGCKGGEVPAVRLSPEFSALCVAVLGCVATKARVR